MKQRKVNRKGVYEYKPAEWESFEPQQDYWVRHDGEWHKVERVHHLASCAGYEQLHKFKDKHDRIDYRLWQEDAPYATSLDNWYGFDVMRSKSLE